MTGIESLQGERVVRHLNTTGLVIRDVEGKGRGVFGECRPAISPSPISNVPLLHDM